MGKGGDIDVDEVVGSLNRLLRAVRFDSLRSVERFIDRAVEQLCNCNAIVEVHDEGEGSAYIIVRCRGRGFSGRLRYRATIDVEGIEVDWHS